MREVQSYFPGTYENSRARFQSRLNDIREHWPDVSLHARTHRSMTALTTDWMSAPATDVPKGLIVVSTALHGIEGYVGSAMMELFVDEFLPRIPPKENSVLLIHAINPWGMAHRRRVNDQNIDLNRNFVAEENILDPTFNMDYEAFRVFLNPQGPVGGPVRESIRFAGGLASALARYGAKRLRSATLMGQYRHARGIYFGGSVVQEETRLIQELLDERAGGALRILMLDMHTGYGPADQMTIVNSCYGALDSAACRRRFDYPRVVAANPQEFYGMRGDMIDFFTAEFHFRHPRKAFYGAAFEFGTVGESLPAILRSLRAMILENKTHHNGAKSRPCRLWVEREFEALFAPQEPVWRRNALSDARRAFEGILRAEGCLG